MLIQSIYSLAAVTVTGVIGAPTYDLSCVRASAEAPFRLPKQEYKLLYEGSRIMYNSLLVGGCTKDYIAQLTSCNKEIQADFDVIIGAASQACREETHKILMDAEQKLAERGCGESKRVQTVKTSADILRAIIALETTSPDESVCTGLVKSVRRAFADELLDIKAPKLAGGEIDFDAELPGSTTRGPSLFAALLAGALAGLLVDMALFPLDTIKTRLQSSAGFRASGGFVGLYQGVGSIALGSAPSSALFFVAYEFASKQISSGTLAGHLLVTTIGEIASSFIRVPADVIKSRQQVDNATKTGQSVSLRAAIQQVYEEGSRPGSERHFLGAFGAFYAGWLSTLVREIPFGCIQFPLFSALKRYASHGNPAPLNMLSTAICGMIAGSIAGSSTTPLDVVKTRIMLSESNESIPNILRRIIREDGVGGLFKGVLPRTLWISLGGAIFLGGYDGIARLIDSI